MPLSPNSNHNGTVTSRVAAAGSTDCHATRVPQALIRRLSLYSRALQHLEMDGVAKVSSKTLGEQLGLNSAQVRKDLTHFGQFGVPGFGYRVADLRLSLQRILRTDRQHCIALVGVGNLGSALIMYGGFQRQGFKICMGFDTDPTIAGTERDGIPVYHVDDLEYRIHQSDIEMAILTVPASAAQDLAERLANAGVTAILNFVPQRLSLPPAVRVHYVDLTIEIESLSYYLL